MKLIDYLITLSVYIRDGTRGMLVDRDRNGAIVFAVYEQKYNTHTLLIETEDEERAVAVLRGDDD